MLNFIVCNISERFSDEQIKKDEVVCACSTNEKEQLCIRGCGGEQKAVFDVEYVYGFV